ncbi:MAG: MAPEG family protein [Woeseiaceae bacterium]
MPASVRPVADNYNHLHEQPTLFYALMFVIVLGPGGDSASLAIVSLYVVLRIVHSLIQILSTNVIARFSLFFLSSLALLALFVHSSIRWLSAG